MNFRFKWLLLMFSLLVTACALPNPPRLPPPTAIPRVTLAAPVSTEAEIPVIDFAQAQAMVDFNIPQPAKLPAGLTLKGAHVQPPNWVQYFYLAEDDDQVSFSVEVFRGAISFNYYYPDSEKKPININSVSGICVRGAWDENSKWLSNIDAVTLEWVTNGFAYHMTQTGLGLSCEDLVRTGELLPTPDK